jgi:hypothetical protein
MLIYQRSVVFVYHSFFRLFLEPVKISEDNTTRFGKYFPVPKTLT